MITIRHEIVTDPLLAEEFWNRVDKKEPLACWVWRGDTWGGMHGSFSYGGVEVTPVQVAWVLLVGPISKGSVLNQVCTTFRCVNPRHQHYQPPPPKTVRLIREPRKPGRKRVHATNADRQRAYRQRRKLSLVH